MFCKMIAYGVQITIDYSEEDSAFGLKVKVACTYHLSKLYYGLQRKLLLQFLNVYVWHNDCKYGKDDNEDY